MSKGEKESKAKDIRLKKNLEQAGSDIERENYVLGLIHGFFDRRQEADRHT